jgi:hypothetical protein
MKKYKLEEILNQNKLKLINLSTEEYININIFINKKFYILINYNEDLLKNKYRELKKVNKLELK